MTTAPICVRCQHPVEKNADSYELFERMHWLCLHLEFEHKSDSDQACGGPSCPWWHIDVLRRKLVALGLDLSDALKEAVVERWKLRDLQAVSQKYQSSRQAPAMRAEKWTQLRRESLSKKEIENFVYVVHFDAVGKPATQDWAEAQLIEMRADLVAPRFGLAPDGHRVLAILQSEDGVNKMIVYKVSTCKIIWTCLHGEGINES